MKKVLVVDDDEDLRSQTIYGLSIIYPNSQFIEAKNGIQAIDRLIKHKPDLILLDIEMPDMNGIEFLRRIRNNKDKNIRNIPIIMFTGVVDKERIETVIKMGVQDYIVKPYELESLYKKVDKYLNEDKQKVDS